MLTSTNTGAFTGPPPPKPKYRRYSDPRLQDAYAHIVAALRTTSIPVYGKIFTEEDADKMAEHAVDAVMALPKSADLRKSALAAVTPAIKAEVHDTVGRLLLGTMAVGLSFVAINAAVRTFRS